MFIQIYLKKNICEYCIIISIKIFFEVIFLKKMCFYELINRFEIFTIE